jgi:hypothetical protein
MGHVTALARKEERLPSLRMGFVTETGTREVERARKSNDFSGKRKLSTKIAMVRYKLPKMTDLLTGARLPAELCPP